MFGIEVAHLLYALLATASIIIPAILIAKQEVAIEGPFGWSALTFTNRFSISHWYSKFFRWITGQDKWATEYHLNSMLIWMAIYAGVIFFIPAYTLFMGEEWNWPAFWALFTLAACCYIELVVVEDYIWFLIHPYYGPARHNKNFVPWFQNFRLGIPKSYWRGMIVTFLAASLTSLFQQNYLLFIIWLLTFILTNFITLGIIRPWTKRIARKNLSAHWWNWVKDVVIQRYPYACETLHPSAKPRVFVLGPGVLKDLISRGEVVLLEDALGQNPWQE